jgi:flagellar hook-length control protein FliK
VETERATGAQGFTAAAVDEGGLLDFTPRPLEGGGERAQKANPLEISFLEIVRAAVADGRTEARPMKAALDTEPGNAPADGFNPAEPNQVQSEAQGEAEGQTVAAATSGARGALEARESSPGSGLHSISRQIISPMVELARQMSNRETRTLRLHLRPEEFGEINLKITRGADGRLSAAMSADLDFTRQALTEGINSLRESLEQSGLGVDRLDVSLAAGSGGEAGSRGADTTDFSSVRFDNARLLSSEEPPAGEQRGAGDPRRLLSLRI